MERQGLEVVDGMGTKVCPQCGQTLFADMDVCYGCLHSFALTEGHASGQALSVGHVPGHLSESVGSSWVGDVAGGNGSSEHERPRTDGSDVSAEGGWRDAPTPSRGAHARRGTVAGLRGDRVGGGRMRAGEGASDAAALSGDAPFWSGASPEASSRQETPTPTRSSTDVPTGVDSLAPTRSRPLPQDEEDATEPNLPVAVRPDGPSATPHVPPSTDTPRLALRVQTSTVDVVVPLPQEGLSVGRSAGNDVVLHSRAVSRRHLRVEPLGAEATVIDLGATNPALYQGREAPAEFVLPLGGAIDVCGTLLTLVADEVGQSMQCLT